MFQPAPTPFAALYYPSSPFSYSTQESSASTDAPPGSRPPPLDPTIFDFGYRAATAVGGGGGAFGAGIGIGPAPGPGLGVGPGPGPGLGPGLGSGSASGPARASRGARGAHGDGTGASGLTRAAAGAGVGVGVASAHPHRIPGQLLQPAATPHLTPTSKAATSTLTAQSYGSYSAPSPSASSTVSCSDSGTSHASYSTNTNLSASPSASCAAASPLPVDQSPANLYHKHQRLPLRHRPRTQRRQSHNALAKMDGHDEQDQHSMAAQQAAAKDYQPEYNVPMVGDLTPSSAITQEYAKADPIYVEKTVNLPQQFSHYRPIRGDGNCGWRVIGYSYFEKLVESGNRAVIDNELARLNEFNNTCLHAHGGFGYWEDFAEAFMNLLSEVAEAMTVDLNGAYFLVHQRWNDEDLNNHIIYYLRMLVSTYLKMNVATYDAFVADIGGIANYCSTNIEAVNKEIEHIGVSALVNVLLKPVNLALQVAYLDLSPGTAPNMYRFPDEANGQDETAFAGVIYTLFRPTHYDILYRTQPPLIQAPAQAQTPAANYSLQVHRVAFNNGPEIHSTAGAMHSFSAADIQTLSMIPGFENASMMSGPPPLGDAFSTPQSPWTPFPDSFAAATPSPQAMTEAPPAVMAATPSPESSSARPIKIQPSPGPVPGLVPGPSPLMRTVSRSSTPAASIRFSPMQLQYDSGKDMFPESAFQVTTSTFKNSVWNRAHFGNPDFHPEEWSPDDENTDGRMATRKRSR